MTSSAENAGQPPPLGQDWRERARHSQQEAMPPGNLVLSCPAPLGGGGLGRHLHEMAGAAERSGRRPTLICESGCTELPATTADLGTRAGEAALRASAPLARLSPAWRIWQASVSFDAAAARRIPEADHLIGFNGTSLAQFAAARNGRCRSVSLVSANSHYEQVISRHRLAHTQYPVERPWPARLLRRNLAEYGQAERIFVATDYIRDSFLQRGFAADRLVSFPLTPDERYRPEQRELTGDRFEIVYVGSLTAHKGVPLLLEAFSRLPADELRLVLVGGWKSRGMRRLIERARVADPRIELAPGDPLPHLLRARLCVHPAYEDGFGYAPAEALACGVPVLVSQDTGMKELIGSARQGLVLPTGDLAALTEAIEAVYRGELLGG